MAWAAEVFGEIINLVIYLKMALHLGVVQKVRLQNLAFFDHLPPSVYIFYGMKVYKKLIFLNTYPPPLVNVVCEQLLVSFYLFLSLKEAWLKS